MSKSNIEFAGYEVEDRENAEYNQTLLTQFQSAVSKITNHDDILLGPLPLYLIAARETQVALIENEASTKQFIAKGEELLIDLLDEKTGNVFGAIILRHFARTEQGNEATMRESLVHMMKKVLSPKKNS